ncbi:MAG: hypothetical protein SGARI_005284 [Bacillariaceae sp.]
MADRMRLKQILLNLSFNATKFVEKGFIRLKAKVVEVKGNSNGAAAENGGENGRTAPSQSQSHPQQHVELYVEDSGPGIPEGKRKSLFNKWQDSLDVLNQGTGIGLALCEKLSVLMECSNGETALRIVDEEQFDLIFVDQYMASVEKQLLGTETVAAMRAKGVKSVICGLSANDVEDQYMKAGADYFLYKPFPCKAHALRDELLQMLATYEVDEEKAPI